ncbi:MAG: GAF domain-containing protein [Chloroflexi bacterium]|nr:GAF domain-containing protein [Chloroflexota bacterium]
MRRLKIGSRLALSFAIILLLMFLVTAVGLWQLNTIQVQATRLHRVDTQAAAVLRVHNNILTLKGELQQLALARGDEAPFAEAARKLRDSFVKDVDEAMAVLGPPPSHAEQIQQLEMIKASLSPQVDTMISLAQANDWVGVQLRLTDEVQQASQTTQELVEAINAEVTIEQQQALESMEQVQQQALITIVIASLLTLLIAGALGFVVTRSIAPPLAHLDAGARALARGEFQHQITVTGDDELSHLSRVFNNAASQLASLYADLERMVQERTEELHHRYRQLETNIAIGYHITAILDLDELLNYVVELIKERFGYYFVGVFLLDENGTHVITQAGTGEAGRLLRQQRLRLKVGEQGIIGWVAKNRRLARVDDVSQDSRYFHLDIIPETRSELALPLVMGKMILGVLDIQSDQVAAFRLDDLPVFQSLADQVATAIQNAFRYQNEKIRRQLAEALHEVSQVLSRTLDLAEVLNLILEYLAKSVPYDRALVMLQNKDELEVAAARGFPADVQPLQVRISIKEDDVFQQIYQTRQPLVIPDVLQRPDWQHVEKLPQARAWLGVPLTRFDQVIGMLSLVREIPNAFSQDEIKLAVTFAGQAAFGLENARLYDKIVRFSQQLEDMVRERTIAVQEAYDQLERLDRTKSDFISIAAHELRTPLTVLRGYSKMLLNDASIKESAHRLELLTGIHNGTVRLQEIVTSMLDIAKIDGRILELYPEPLNLPSVIELVAQTFSESLAERKQSLTIADMTDLPSIMADPDAMHKVFYHLIVNAIKYTPDGGKITVTGRCLNGDSGGPFPGIEIIVSDTGIGIDPAARELIFTKFYQTGELALHSTGKTVFKGAGPGLGLAIAKGIVEAHHGKIWVESQGHDEETFPGSQFHVVLPLRQRH